MISKTLRTYKRTHGLRQICNVVVYMVHSACTIHLLNLPDKEARRDIVHNVRALEEIAESWLSARRSLLILSTQAQKWKSDLPSDAAAVFTRVEEKFGRNFTNPSNPESASLSSQLSPMSASTPATSLPPSGNLGLAKSTLPKKTAVLRVKTGKGSPSAAQSLTNKYSPQSMASASSSAADVASPHSTGMLPSAVAQSASGSMLIGSYPNYQNSKDWWMKDQSAIFDQWVGSADASSIGSAVTAEGSQAQARAAWDATMMGVGGERHQQSGNRETAVEGEVYREEGSMYGLEYLDFPPGHIYGYPRGGNGGGT